VNQLGPNHHSTKDVARSLAQIEGGGYPSADEPEFPTPAGGVVEPGLEFEHEPEPAFFEPALPLEHAHVDETTELDGEVNGAA
jgi:hypothetical protein